VAELEKEEAYWRGQHAKQPYADKNLGYEHYARRIARVSILENVPAHMAQKFLGMLPKKFAHDVFVRLRTLASVLWC
jgi:hypothetical protein